MNDDNHSTCSTTSVSESKIICNYCKEEITQKVIFNHLRKKHEDEFLFNLEIKHIKTAIKSKSYLELELMVPDERDESEKRFITLYCVLGTTQSSNKCYVKTNGAINLLKKKPEMIGEHLKQLNTLLTLKEAELNKRPVKYLKNDEYMEYCLRRGWHFITYLDHPLEKLKQKEIDISSYRITQNEMKEKFHSYVRLLKEHSKDIHLEHHIAMGISSLNIKVEHIFAEVANIVDRLYDYPIWIENAYFRACTEHNPEGRKFGDKADYFNNLTYPGME